jgi:hypothetical protein
MPSRHGSAQRHVHVGADDADVALQVPQLDIAEGQALPLQPPQVVHQVVGIGPLRARPVMNPQEPVRLLVDRALGPHDRPRPPPALPVDPLDPQVPHDHPPRHPSPRADPWDIGDAPDQVGKEV